MKCFQCVYAFKNRRVLRSSWPLSLTTKIFLSFVSIFQSKSMFLPDLKNWEKSNGREAVSGTEAQKQLPPPFLLRSCCNQTTKVALLSISEKALILYELLFSLNGFRLQTCICSQILNQLQGQTPAEDLWKSWNHLYVFLYPVNLVQLRNNLAVDRYLLKAAVLADEPNGWCWQAWIFCTSSHLFPLIEARMTILPVDFLPVRVIKGKKYDIRTVRKLWVMKQIYIYLDNIRGPNYMRLYLKAIFSWCSWSPLLNKQ